VSQFSGVSVWTVQLGVGQTSQDVAQVGKGIDSTTTAGLDDGVEDGTSLAGLCMAKEEPVSKPAKTLALFDFSSSLNPRSFNRESIRRCLAV